MIFLIVTKNIDHSWQDLNQYKKSDYESITYCYNHLSTTPFVEDNCKEYFLTLSDILAYSLIGENLKNQIFLRVTKFPERDSLNRL